MSEEITTEKPQRRRHFTDDSITTWKEFRPGKARKVVRHPYKLGHYVIVQPVKKDVPGIVRSWAVEARDPITKKQVWKSYGRCDRMSVEDAAVEGDKIIARIRKGLPPVEPPAPCPETVRAMADDWLKCHVDHEGLRTAPEIRRRLSRYILPRIGDRVFVELQRTDIVRMLDAIADQHGPRQADTIYTVMMSVARWHESRSNYVVAFAGIRRYSKAAPRERVLSQNEIRTIWRAAESENAGMFGAIVQLALLTGQRKEKITSMRHDDIVDGTWRIPQLAREKDAGGDLVLPRLALDVIAAEPRHAVNRHVFPARWGPGHVHTGLASMKAQFETRLPAGFEPWTIHDLRRTARSLMSEAKIDRDIAEMVLGHKIGTGVARIYDRHAYKTEKAEALQRLADLIKIILGGPADNVVPLLRPGA